MCAAAFLAAVALTALARRYALSRQLVDAPGERRSHTVATPRGGGIAIVAVVLPLMIWSGCAGARLSPVVLFGACGLALVAAIGWIDDHRPLSPWGRLAIHIFAAALLACGVAWAGQPLWWAIVVFALALGLVNVWNFMDGINGLAASQLILVAMGFLLLGMHGEGAFLACVAAAACAGFLPFNFPRGRIFLGDVGSGALGYLVACLIALSPATDPVGGLVWLLPISPFLIDATLTLLSRIIRGERWWTPHVQHMYQRCVQAGHAHAVVTGGYAAWTLSSTLVAIWMAGATHPVIIGAFATWYLLGVTIWLTFRIRHARRMRVS
ncbi:UDP-N-acetylmuramyl pentapeptide phosphotransferase/UDP-N-acetylglucosamine-1-phosphate transferase [Luteimonas terrae]|uniref:UDP-N-acetylmuramyl pentapeptide phosphotransferase/UDP-N-acetylglucosamine-1-phosphate transferase n=1 Tax=Luteimonas terrae TaxID=1530191 RepID=A0ABU1XWA3_9GAMM|nr:UDP-N-acetylmuramyl pentapeptide phosphotransferase/UDP-N-acetylglucosamine-1-phosphate transferase [Luteimonas terrae]